MPNIKLFVVTRKIMKLSPRWLATFALLVYFIFSPFQPIEELRACMICVPYPEKTLADRLLDQDKIVFAREAQGSPSVFSLVETLRGTVTTDSVEFFCDSFTRKKLQAIPDSVVVLAQLTGQDKWQMITFADKTLQSFIKTIVQHSTDWSVPSGKPKRVRFFSMFLNNEQQLIQEQAYLEVGRAPYSMIRNIALEIPKEQIYEFLGNHFFTEWHSLYILFLGQSKSLTDRAYIRKQVESAARFNRTTNLAAWLTAFIESTPETAINEIEKWYFSNPNRSKSEIEQVMTTMSMLGSLEVNDVFPLFPFRNKIVKSYVTLLKNYPKMAGRVAKDLSMWQVLAYIDRLTEIREKQTPLDPSDAYLIDYYLSVAPKFQKLDLDRVN